MDETFDRNTSIPEDDDPLEFGPGFTEGIHSEKDIRIEQGGALSIQAKQNIDVAYGGALGMIAGGDMTVTNGGAWGMVSGGNTEITNGGSLMMTIGGNTEITNGGSVVMLAQNVTADNATFGVVLSSQVNLGENTKVMFNTKQALAFGAAAGAVFALLSVLFRRR